MSTRKSIAVLIAYGLLLIVVGWLLWSIVHRLFFLPAENAANKANAIVQEETATAAGAAAGTALETVREVHTEYRRIDEISRSNEHAIKTAPGADARAADVAGALRRGLCHHRTYQRDPGCAAVLGDGESIGAARSDDGRTAAR